MDIRATDWEEAALPVLDEAGCAAWQAARGGRVVEHRGRYWLESSRFFFQPVHHLARLSRAEATRPVPWCLGFRALLTADDGAHASGAMPAHLLPASPTYSLARLSQHRRREIRQGLRSFDLVALTGPDLLLDQGFATAREAHARNPGIVLPDEATFRRTVLSYFDPPQGLLLAALRGDRLIGFSLTFAVGHAVYHDLVYVGREGLKCRAPICLFHALADIATRDPRLVELMHGLHVRDNPGLCEFKRRLGLEVTRLPARVWLAPGVKELLRLRSPHRYYRLTGQD